MFFQVQSFIPKILSKKTLIAVDCSGSCWPSTDEMMKILNSINAPGADLALFTHTLDAVVKNFKKNPDKMKQALLTNGNNGGGTLLEEVMAYAKENKYEHICFITDGYLNMPTDIKDFKTSWILQKESEKMDYPGEVFHLASPW
jgi:predicted metal-dependent peptidase